MCRFAYALAHLWHLTSCMENNFSVNKKCQQILKMGRKCTGALFNILKYPRYQHNYTLSKRCFVTSNKLFSIRDGIFSTSIPEFENKYGIKSYTDLHKFSINETETFWDVLAKSRVQWMKEYDTIQDCRIADGDIKWFLNGKLNVSGNSLWHYAHFHLYLQANLFYDCMIWSQYELVRKWALIYVAKSGIHKS